MAYSMRDIIKQRTGEVASSGIQPTIFKFRLEDDWQTSYDIVKIGTFELTNTMVYSYEVKDELPVNSYIKQVGSNVKRVSFINVENDIIPPDIFKFAFDVEDFQYCFKNAYIQYIPEHLFDNCRKAVNFKGTFNNNVLIKSIPENLFANCIKAKVFYKCFEGCLILKEIPENLFANCLEVRTFENVFRMCIKLKEIPMNIFKFNKKDAIYRNCFNECISALNFKNIPIDWRMAF